MKRILFLTLLLTACDESDLYPISDCNASCVITETGELLLWEEAENFSCNVGTLICVGESRTCEGYKLKEIETCNGFDDDCDGLIDNIPHRVQGSANNTCRDLEGVCALSEEHCIGGEWTCIPPEMYGLEKCDGFDNDCRNGADSNDPNLIFSGPLFGYDGPIATANVGQCRPWVRKCINGYEVKEGQVLPEPEECSDGIDNDCDGLIDEYDGNVEESFLLSLDGSGSMEGMHAVLTNAICNWATTTRFQDSKFAIAIAGISSWKDGEEWVSLDTPYYHVFQDFDTAAVTCQTLIDITYDWLPGGYELFPQFVLETSNHPNLNWPEGLEKNVIIFSDEAPQSIPVDGAPLTSSTWQNDQVAEDCQPQHNNYEIGVLTEIHLKNHWEDIALPCDGWVDVLDTNFEDMADLLSEKFGGTC